MKVLLISHACRSHSAGQRKAQLLGEKLDVELQLVVPHIWNDSWNDRGAWKEPEPPVSPSYTFSPMKVRWPWLGPAQSYLHWYPGLKKVTRDFQPDVIDVWEEPWSMAAAHVCWLRDRVVPAAKIICETEQNILKKLPLPFEIIRRFVLRRVDLMVGRSEEAVQVLRRQGYHGPADVVPNAVDTEIFKPMERSECRRKLGVEGFTVGYVGRLVEAKGVSDLLNAISLLPDGVKLLIVGRGDYELEIKRLIGSLALASRVTVLPAVPPNELPAIFNAMDVLVVPSRTTPRWKEQFGRVIIEAHACGIPVIGSSSGAIPGVVGEGGLVFPEQNPAALAEAIHFLLADETSRSTMGQLGFNATKAQYTWESVAAQMRELYDRVSNVSHDSVENHVNGKPPAFAPAGQSQAV